VLDIHDGELVPSLENRRTVARLIRNHQADIVMGHRPYDYHADHRYTGVLLNDAAVFVPNTPPTQGNPIFLHYPDRFEDPLPYEPHLVVDIDASAEKKWQCVLAMPSQFGDKDSWGARMRANVPEDETERKMLILESHKRSSAAVADRYREMLVQQYGQERGSKVQYAEAFRINQYGRQVSVDQLKQMFPTF
jgi:N-acetylglucosamine malate deacetylase 1